MLPKDVLVTTSSSVFGYEVKKIIKPVSAHLVAGTNLFNDFFASFSDVFGGRSQSYQKQIKRLYNDAIDQLKNSAFELGANCIVGLNIDLDEISGKGKSMFMLTAVGTAVVINSDQPIKEKTNFENENLDQYTLNAIIKRKHLIKMAHEKKLELNEENWEFIINNGVYEVFDTIIEKLRRYATSSDINEVFNNLLNKTFELVSYLPEKIRAKTLYKAILEEENDILRRKLSELLERLCILDFDEIENVLNNEDFNIKKSGVALLMYDKPFYSKADIEKFEFFIDYLKNNFKEKGERTTKKQLLSSKEKEVWICECKTSNEIGKFCSQCNKDIYGFKSSEISPKRVIEKLQDRVEALREVYNNGA